MAMPKRLIDYLDEVGVDYRVRAHELSHTSVQSARLAHVLPHHLAKPVMLEDAVGCLMAVVPANHQVNIASLARMLDR